MESVSFTYSTINTASETLYPPILGIHPFCPPLLPHTTASPSSGRDRCATTLLHRRNPRCICCAAASVPIAYSFSKIHYFLTTERPKEYAALPLVTDLGFFDTTHQTDSTLAGGVPRAHKILHVDTESSGKRLYVYLPETPLL